MLTSVNADNESNTLSLVNSLLNKVEASDTAPDWMKRTTVDLSVEKGYKPTWSLETIQPIYQHSSNDMYFWQFNAATRNDIETYNLGFGYRNIINPDLMLGINSFYDYQQTNKHKRWSIGAEAIGQTIEFRTNRYMAISDKLEVEAGIFEQALDGWDVELGGTIPNTELRTFATYTVWDGVTKDDLKQKALRVEYPLNDSMKFEVGYTADNEKQGDLEKTRWNAQLSIAFGAKTASSQNIATSTNLKDKLLIPVQRENEIVVERTVGAVITVSRGN
jgi:hypothetical protein